MFKQTEALPIHTRSKLHYLIHELYLTNHLSFLELLDCGTHCHPLLSLNPTICHLLNLILTNLILSPFLLKLPLIFSVFPLSGHCYRPYCLSRHYLLKKENPNGPSASFIYPRQQDLLLVAASDLLTTLNPKTLTGRTFTLSIEDEVSASAALYCHLRL